MHIEHQQFSICLCLSYHLADEKTRLIGQGSALNESLCVLNLALTRGEKRQRTPKKEPTNQPFNQLTNQLPNGSTDR